MVRVIDAHDVITGNNAASGLKYYEYAGLSTDTKPTSGVATGSCFMEVNTGDVYLYDEAGNTWNKVGG